MRICTYLRIKDQVISVTSEDKPVYHDFSANSADNFSYEYQLEQFEDSFIEVSNPEVLDKTNLGLPIGFIDANAIYAVPDGLEFEVISPINARLSFAILSLSKSEAVPDTTVSELKGEIDKVSLEIMMPFIKWYSGMPAEKIRRAYECYVKEVLTKD